MKKIKVNSEEPSDTKQLGVLLLPPGWDATPLQDTQHVCHEMTRSFTTSPGWDVSPSQDTQHKMTKSISSHPALAASPSHDTWHEVIRSITSPPCIGC